MLKIGHRGAAGHEPENTLRSFKKAIELGANYVEFDARTTMDGELVVFHDEDLNRIAKIPALLKHKTLAEVKKLNAGKEEVIPTVREALEFLKGRTRIVIELKERGYNPQLLGMFHDFAPWREEELIIIAFDEDDSVEGGHSSWRDLAFLKHAFPQLETGLLFTPQKFARGATYESICVSAREMRARFLAPYYKMVTPDAVELVHTMGL